ncbi:hypothetical protein V1514DRAFT_334575 [Lipomyces japonicus]|uniref:uncharacterized protein n=1 Tax=Lipomyces japonicus TaxID=56871 RepID=UPI0034CDABD4
MGNAKKIEQNVQAKPRVKPLLPAKVVSDKAIQGTNGSSIVSKRSVERLYYPTDNHTSKVINIPSPDSTHDESISPFVFENSHFFKYFVTKPQRRAPLINRGYWIRMEAIHAVVKQFLNSRPESRKVVINLGCGYDPLPFQYLSKKSTDRSKTIFIDADYADLISIKVDTINKSPELQAIIGKQHSSSSSSSVQDGNNNNNNLKLISDSYLAIGCDLSKLDEFENALRQCDVINADSDILFVAEVSLTYMDTDAANAVIQWASKIGGAQTRFALLEQMLPAGPEHPFARTMLQHFNRLNTAIKSVTKYQTIQSQADRFKSRGWLAVDCIDLLELWTNRISQQEKFRLSQIEEFDEWEEFYLFGQHYFILQASNQASDSDQIQSVSNHDTELLLPDYEWQIETLKSARLNRKFSAAAKIDQNNSTFIFGGLGPGTRLDTSALLAQQDQDVELQISTVQSRPQARMCHSLSSIGYGNSDVVLIGGRQSPSLQFSDAWVFHASEQAWQKIADMPTGRSRHAAATLASGDVVVFGGIIMATTDGATHDWLLLNQETLQWQSLACETDLGVRISPVFARLGPDFGIISGGFDNFGKIHQDAFRWQVQAGGKVTVTPIHGLPEIAFRAGAQVSVVAASDFLIIGGVKPHGLLELPDSILRVNLDFKSKPLIKRVIVQSDDQFPMLIGVSTPTHASNSGHVVLAAGGAVCFSFGAIWHGVSILHNRNISVKGLKLVDERDRPAPTRVACTTVTGNIIPARAQPGTITSRDPRSVSDWADIYASSVPVLVCNQDIGPCVTKWTAEYLKANVEPDRMVNVHVSKTGAMNFQAKNFRYETVRFAQLIDHVYQSHPANEHDELYYLRSLSVNHAKSEPANLHRDFAKIASDFVMPQSLRQFIDDKIFSSPLRISSAGVGMWLHYDVTANVLFQVRGSKKIRLYPPSDVSKLRFPPGASSSTISNIFDHDHDDIVDVDPIEVIMRPGDYVFIPAMWIHATVPLEPSVSVNFFYKDLPSGSYSWSRDVYGNKDLKSYEDGRQLIKKIGKSFAGLPFHVRQFYLDRLSDELRQA